MGEIEKCLQNCSTQPERKRPLVRTWNDSIKMGLKEICCEGMDGIKVTHNKDQCLTLVSTAVNLPIPQKATNYLTR
jgi:hypothetical protein